MVHTATADSAPPELELWLFKTLWGHDGSPLEAAEQARTAGFQGLEAPAPATPAAAAEFSRSLATFDLRYIAEICTAGSYVPDRRAPPEVHLKDLEQKLALSTPLDPLFCNVMGGCDAWPIDCQVEFFGRARELAARHGITCSFETHRGRPFFNPWITRDILRQLPGLPITCDFSHWVVVSESLLDTEWDLIAEVAQHAHHIHGRVGYDQGPQVPHPAAPEYAEALAFHERCWETIWESQRARGYRLTTLTPESGPDGYLHCLPFTSAPVADLWEVNCWMGQRQQRQFGKWQHASAGAAAI